MCQCRLRAISRWGRAHLDRVFTSVPNQKPVWSHRREFPNSCACFCSLVAINSSNRDDPFRWAACAHFLDNLSSLVVRHTGHEGRGTPETASWNPADQHSIVAKTRVRTIGLLSWAPRWYLWSSGPWLWSFGRFKGETAAEAGLSKPKQKCQFLYLVTWKETLGTSIFLRKPLCWAVLTLNVFNEQSLMNPFLF